MSLMAMRYEKDFRWKTVKKRIVQPPKVGGGGGRHISSTLPAFCLKEIQQHLKPNATENNFLDINFILVIRET